MLEDKTGYLIILEVCGWGAEREGTGDRRETFAYPTLHPKFETSGERDSTETWKNVHSEFSGRRRCISSVTGRKCEPMALLYLWTNQRMDLLPEIWENIELWVLWNYECSHANHCQNEEMASSRGEGAPVRWQVWRNRHSLSSASGTQDPCGPWDGLLLEGVARYLGR